MSGWWQDRPLVIAASVLFGIVFARAQATYWLGRAARAGSLRTRWASRLSGPRFTAASGKLHRWGAPLITVSFLTIGLQTVVNAAAGITGMHWFRYTAAMVPGCVAWALLYATVGWAAVQAWLALAVRSTWWALLLLAAVTALVLLVVRRRRSAAGSSRTAT